MRVLHLALRGITGGGAHRGTYQLHRALLAAGIDSHLLVREKDIDDDTVTELPRRATTWLESLPARIRQKRDRMQIPADAEFTTDRATMAPAELVGIEAYDVVHLHHINHGFDEEILFGRVKKTQRLFWTLHDAYPFTGGCHVVRDCMRYTDICGCCPQLGSDRENDLSSQILKRKLERLRDLDMTFIGQSRWIVACAQQSTIGKDIPHRVIPEAIDTTQFVPTDRGAAKQSLRVPKDKVVVGWMGVTVSDARKGLDLLQDAMQRLDPDRYHVLWAGGGEYDLRVPCTHTRLSSRKGLAQVNEFYAACDVMAVPSREESFCLVACEASSCGTPVVAFAATGLLDAISDGENGFLVEPFSPAALKDEIERIAALPSSKYEELRDQMRRVSVAKYDLAVLAQRHIEVYQG
ncbi:MAG: glycosyltransferase [Fimbriimonadaceae bacterium]